MQNPRPKVLFVTPTFPYPIDAGGRVAQFFILDFLKDYFEITLLSLQLDNPYLEGFKKACPAIKTITIPKGIRSTINKVKRKIQYETNRLTKKNQPTKFYIDKSSSWYEKDKTVLNFLKIFDFSPFDLVQFDFIESGAYLSELNIQVPTILVHHELRFVRCEREFAVMANDENRVKLSANLKEIKKIELNAMKQFDHIIVFSEVDQEVLKGLNIKAEIHTSPFGSNLILAKNNKPYTFKNKLVYLGGERHLPNKDAVQWFVNHIWPKVVKRNPACKFLITGNWTAATKEQLTTDSNIQFTGMVDDIAEVLEGSILVVPLRIGSGIRTKIFEAFALKVPVLTTNIGIEGIPAENDVHCFIEDDAPQFASKLNQLFDQDLNAITENAFQFYKDIYTVEECGAKRLNILQNIISGDKVLSKTSIVKNEKI